MTGATLARYQSDPIRTFGFLRLPDGWGCYTLELPWRGNARGASCIPDGNYTLALRRSPKVESITKGRYFSGYEVTNVTGRTYIMVHPGNWPRNSNGCILLGGEPTSILGEWGVPNSQAVFTEFMRRMAALSLDGPVPLSVRWNLDESPRHKAPTK